MKKQIVHFRPWGDPRPVCGTTKRGLESFFSVDATCEECVAEIQKRKIGDVRRPAEQERWIAELAKDGGSARKGGWVMAKRNQYLVHIKTAVLVDAKTPDEAFRAASASLEAVFKVREGTISARDITASQSGRNSALIRRLLADREMYARTLVGTSTKRAKRKVGV